MGTGVLVIVQNLPVPMDRRVWLECQALRDAGYQVSVICPKAPGDPDVEVLDGVHLYKYQGAPATEGLLSYVFEFAYSWLRTAALSIRAYREHRFSIMQACNPPDTYWLLAWFFRLLGVRFVFDQHDLNPELFRSRFGDPKRAGARAQLAVLTWLERRTYATADHVIVTNGSYRRIAQQRGALPPHMTTVVRSGPDTTRMRPGPVREELRHGKPFLLAYLGIMGPQDDVDVLLRVMDRIVHERGRTDVHLALLGFGDCLDALQAESARLGLAGYVTFTGRADAAMIADHLSAAHLGLAPDRKTPLNDLSTHNKTMEYMAFGLPVVSFDLVESRVSAADSAVYVTDDDEAAFADAVLQLLDDPQRRLEMGAAARARCVAELDWRPQALAYVGVFDALSGADVTRRTTAVPVGVSAPDTTVPVPAPASAAAAADALARAAQAAREALPVQARRDEATVNDAGERQG